MQANIFCQWGDVNRYARMESADAMDSDDSDSDSEEDFFFDNEYRSKRRLLAQTGCPAILSGSSNASSPETAYTGATRRNFSRQSSPGHWIDSQHRRNDPIPMLRKLIETQGASKSARGTKTVGRPARDLPPGSELRYRDELRKKRCEWMLTDGDHSYHCNQEYADNQVMLQHIGTHTVVTGPSEAGRYLCQWDRCRASMQEKSFYNHTFPHIQKWQCCYCDSLKISSRTNTRLKHLANCGAKVEET
ncbi:hypothetical protein C8J56DRAFT_1060579 [Mycena floridula]|nr:hypothetical protein C8J56DRAFT_1060579 [Mycena floridula]